MRDQKKILESIITGCNRNLLTLIIAVVCITMLYEASLPLSNTLVNRRHRVNVFPNTIAELVHKTEIDHAAVEVADFTLINKIRQESVSPSNVIGDTEEVKIENKIEYDFTLTGLTTANLNIRKEPNTDSEILGKLNWSTSIKYADFDDEWAVIDYDGDNAYISKRYITDKMDLPNTYYDINIKSRKSYMGYKAITNTKSPQYRLQNEYAVTADNGVRTVNGRYCIALGSYYTKKIGTYVDLVLSNGLIIPCIVGDSKADANTNANNSIGNDGSIAEFIVDTPKLSSEARKRGDVGYTSNGWDSKIIGIKVYNKSLF